MFPSSKREDALNNLKAEAAALPDGDPRKLLLTELVAGGLSTQGQQVAQRAAIERVNAMPDSDPRKALYAQMMTSPQPAQAPPPSSLSTRNAPVDVWPSLEALGKRDEVLVKLFEAVDARVDALVIEARRLTGENVELHDLVDARTT